MLSIPPNVRQGKPALYSLGLALALASHSTASADVVFSEGFESPAVSGFQDNTVPDNGNWIGSSGAFNASVRGPYNESVIAPATPPFTTPYGKQAYHLAYSTTMLTTAQNATGVTITAGETYTLTCNAAHLDGATADYKVQLVAFDVTDDDASRQNPNSPAGTIVAEATGAIAGSDMSQTVSVVFAPDGANAHLGKELAIRFDDGEGDALYDNVRLIVGHDYAPSPESGIEIDAGGDVTLSWTNKPPVDPATETPVDILFGTDPGAMSPVVDGQVTSSTVVSAPSAGTYYWQIVSYTDGNPEGTGDPSAIFSFSFDDTDGDGLPDDWELANFGDPTIAEPNGDPDSDGLENLGEYNLGTDPNIPDTDADGLLDGVETATGTWVSASDTGTLPLVDDTDADGLLDGVESNTGTWGGASDTGTDPNDSDYDDDGLLDGAETNTGTYIDRFDTGTDPFDSDTDADGAGDYYESVATFTNPNSDTEVPANVVYPLPDPDPADLGATSVPVKVYIMAGQSNTVGIGYTDGIDSPGSLDNITKKQNRFPNLIDASGLYTARNDVIYRGVVTANGNNGPLTKGQGGGNNRLGPELGFGHVMGYYHGEPVLILKASQGNRSLAWDFCPPSGPRFDFDGETYAGYGDTVSSWPIGDPVPTADPITWYAGKQYDECFRDESDWPAAGANFDPILNAADVLDFETGTLTNLPTEGNDLNGRTFEVAGFVWWQGHKDGGEERTGTAGAYATQYEDRLVDLINDLRTDFNAPSAPFVVATVGFGGGGWDPGSSGDTIWNAQMNVSDPGLYPAFENNVGSVDTTDYWRDTSESPGNQGFHYNNNAETYTLVGDAMGRKMIELVQLAESSDTLPPAITTTVPTDNAVDVSAGVNLEASFNDTIAIGTGNITIYNVTDGGAGNVVIDVTDTTQVSIDSAGFTLLINPSVNLADNKEYAVQFEAGSILDDAGNSFAGISDTTTWSFTTAAPDTTPPTVQGLTPSNGSADVVPGINLEATFSEPIMIGTGDITLVDTDDGSGTRVIDVTDATQISVDGDTLIINPSADLDDDTSYAVQIDATAIDDLVGNSYAGIADNTTWAFTTPLPGVVFSDGFELPDVDGYNIQNTSQSASGDWVRATTGFNSNRNGVVDDVYEGNWDAPGGQQAYAFRYTNSGLTTATGVIGALTEGTTISVSFDVFIDGYNGGDTIEASLVTFNGGTRNDIDGGGMIQGTSSYLVEDLLTAPASGFERFTLSYTVGGDVVDADGEGGGSSTTFDPAVLGHDIAVRFDGATSAASIDNVLVTVISDVVSGEDYTTWISGYDVGGDTGPDQDPDGDGLSNAAENYFGTDPSTHSAGLAATQVDKSSGTTFEFTHPISDSPASDISAVYKWTADLQSGFLNDGATDGNGTTVTFVPGTPANGEVTVSANISGTEPEKVFVTVDVTQDL